MKKINLEIKISKEELKKKLDIKDGKNGKNGKDGIGHTGPEGKQGIPGKQGSPDTPSQVRDKLESLKKGEKLTINAIEDLAEILEELAKKGSLGLLKGSLHTSKGKEIRFIDDETPSGTIDGANTDFVTLKTPISGSLKLYRGGGRMRITEDYTLSGKTITFIIAPQVGEVILVDYRY